MRWASEAWADAHEPGSAHISSRYKPVCACCTPEVPAVQAGRPQRRTSQRPVLAWRARLAALQTQNESNEANRC